MERKVKELEDQNKRIAIDLRDSLKKEIIEALRIEKWFVPKYWAFFC